MFPCSLNNLFFGNKCHLLSSCKKTFGQNDLDIVFFLKGCHHHDLDLVSLKGHLVDKLYFKQLSLIFFVKVVC